MWWDPSRFEMPCLSSGHLASRLPISAIISQVHPVSSYYIVNNSPKSVKNCCKLLGCLAAMAAVLGPAKRIRTQVDVECFFNCGAGGWEGTCNSEGSFNRSLVIVSTTGNRHSGTLA